MKSLTRLALAGLTPLSLAFLCCGGVWIAGRTLLARQTGPIAFVSLREGGWEVYQLNRNGLYTDLTRLTFNQTNECCPAWSPDGRQIAFAAWRQGNKDIYVMEADGSGLTRLTAGAANEWKPAWSLDSARIAFESDQSSSADIYVMNRDGTGQMRLTFLSTYDGDPSWSPNGDWIAFESDRDRDQEIYLVNAREALAGAAAPTEVRLTDSRLIDGDPVWSPDGSQIAFQSFRDGNAEIYVIEADGTNPTRLTANATPDLYPAWAPDGRHLIFTSFRDGNPELYLMNADGSRQTRLTSYPGEDYEPAWSP